MEESIGGRAVSHPMRISKKVGVMGFGIAAGFRRSKSPSPRPSPGVPGEGEMRGKTLDERAHPPYHLWRA